MIRVLVIDDDVYMRELICYVLEDTPYMVDEAASGAQGSLQQQAQPAHVVIRRLTVIIVSLLCLNKGTRNGLFVDVFCLPIQAECAIFL